MGGYARRLAGSAVAGVPPTATGASLCTSGPRNPCCLVARVLTKRQKASKAHRAVLNASFALLRAVNSAVDNS